MLTPKVLTVTASYGTMALFHVAFMSILPVFYATPIELGGLSLDPPRIGAILGASGLTIGAFQMLFFARVNDRFGTKTIHTTGILSGIPIVILFPVINALARAHGIGWAVWLAIWVQLTLTVSLLMCYRMSIQYFFCAFCLTERNTQPAWICSAERLLPIAPRSEQPMESSSWLLREQGSLVQHLCLQFSLIRCGRVMMRGRYITS